jgi:zinc transport system substrate-binding protein
VKLLTVMPAIAIAAGLAAGCSRSSDPVAPAAAAGPLRVAAVNAPLAYFAERIGGDHVEVVFPVPADVDPAFWSPDADAVSDYQQADVILLNGAGYAQWTERTTLPVSRVVDTSATFADRLIEIEGSVVHAHGPAGEHSHGAIAFTTWLDPELALAHAVAVRDALTSRRPDSERAFTEGFDALAGDLGALDGDLAVAFGPLVQRPLLGSHPVYQYLAARYGLDIRSVHFEPGEVPDDRAWRELEAILEDHPARLMLWEGDPHLETAERLEALGVEVIVFDPCGNRPEEGDWLGAMRRNVNRVKAASTAAGG